MDSTIQTSQVLAFRAGDVMSRDVVTITPGESLRDVVASLTFNQVSGLPVVEADGRCVGVISASDVLHFEDDFALGIDGRNQIVGSYFDPVSMTWDMVRMLGESEAQEAVTVREEMSSDIVSVTPQTPLTTVAELMLASGVHRVLVLDEEGHLHGVVSATQFVEVFADLAEG